MNLDTELDLWRRQWQSDTAVHSDLRRKVDRQSRWMKIALTADTLVTIVIGGGAIAWAALSPQADIVLLAVATWLFLAAAWTFTIVVHHRNWSPSGLDTSAFVEFLVRRCRGALAAIWFGAVLFLTEIVFCLAWIRHHIAEPRTPLSTWLFFSSIPLDIVWLVTLLFFAFLVWYRKRKLAELAYLQTLRESLRQEIS